MDEAKLIEQLRKVEALFAGATTDGEQNAAANVRERILEKLEQIAQLDPPVDYKFTVADEWSRMLFMALLRRYGLRPYRYRRQRYTTIRTQVSRRFVEETLWPEFEQLDKLLRRHLGEVTQRIVFSVLDADSSDAEVIDEPRQLT